MMHSIATYLPIVMLFSVFLLILIVLYFIREYYRLKNHRFPFTQNFLRSPGQSLLQEIDSINRDQGPVKTKPRPGPGRCHRGI